MEDLLAALPPDLDSRDIDGPLDRFNDTTGEAMLAAVQFVRSLGLLPRLPVRGAA